MSSKEWTDPNFSCTTDLIGYPKIAMTKVGRSRIVSHGCSVQDPIRFGHDPNSILQELENHSLSYNRYSKASLGTCFPNPLSGKKEAPRVASNSLVGRSRILARFLMSSKVGLACHYKRIT